MRSTVKAGRKVGLVSLKNITVVESVYGLFTDSVRNRRSD